MRIAVLTGSFLPVVGGLEWKAHYLSEDFVRHGHDVTLFTTHPPKAFAQKPMPVSPTYRLVRSGTPRPGFGRLGIIQWLVCRAVLAEHRRRPFDVLHCHHLGEPTRWGVLVKRRTGVPVVSTTCGDDVYAVAELQYGVRLVPRLDRIVRENARSVDVIGSVSRAVRDELEQMGATARIVDIPNGVPWEDFQTGPSGFLRDRLSLKREDLIIISVGRLVNFKRYDLGLPAFARVAPQFPRAHYVLIGRETTKLDPLVEQLGMRGRIHFIEELNISELPKVFHSADVFFNPSMLEGFAQVNAQALASGLPCVITDAPGNVDAGDHGGAVITRCNDVSSMAEGLAKILGDAALRKRLAGEAFAASPRYDWRTISGQYQAIFQELIGKSGAARARNN